MSISNENDFVIENGNLMKYTGNDGGTVVIPAGVTRIASNTFDIYCTLDELIIPDSVTEIERLSLPRSGMIRMPKYLKSIEENNLTGISKIQFYSSIKANIGDIYRPYQPVDCIVEVISPENDTLYYSVYLTAGNAAYKKMIKEAWKRAEHFDFESYDGFFSKLDEPEQKRQVAVFRLKNPYGLADAARKKYHTYLRKNANALLRDYIETDDFDSIEILIKENVFDQSSFDYAINFAKENHASLSMLTRLIKAKKDYFGDGVSIKMTEKAIVPGGVIEMGKLPDTDEMNKWMVIDVKKDRYLLICLHCVAVIPFADVNKKAEKGIISWENSYVRKWLNTSFYKSCFSAKERGKILHTTLSAKSSGKTEDYLFLLKEDQFMKYFFCTDLERHLKSFYDTQNLEIFSDVNRSNQIYTYSIDASAKVSRKGLDRFYDKTSVKDYHIRPAMWISSKE